MNGGVSIETQSGAFRVAGRGRGRIGKKDNVETIPGAHSKRWLYKHCSVASGSGNRRNCGGVKCAQPEEVIWNRVTWKLERASAEQMEP
jgi:hypothetical protein